MGGLVNIASLFTRLDRVYFEICEFIQFIIFNYFFLVIYLFIKFQGFYVFLLRVFHNNADWWFLTWVSVTTSPSRLQDFSLYSAWSKQWCSLNGLHSSFYFHVLQSLNQSFSDSTERTSYNWCDRYSLVSQFFQCSSKVLISFHFLLVLPSG